MSHRPKTAALIAYAEELLSPKGRARLERHLVGCPTCQRELASILLYERMAEDARMAPEPAVDFSRMERALADEAERVSREIVRAKRRPSWGWAAVALAAAALLALVLWPEAEPAVVERADEPEPEQVPPEAPSAEPAALAAVVTLSAGGVSFIDAGGAPLEASAGAALGEGTTIRTDGDGLVHVRLSDGTGIVVPAHAEVRLARAREDAVALELVAGRVDSTVAPLASGSTYVVLAAGHHVEVRGTRFAVVLDEGAVDVELAEGAVEVETPSGEHVALSAPARWSSDGSPTGAPRVAAARGLTSVEGTAPVTLAHPELVRWQIDEVEVSASSVTLELPAGEHEVRGWDARGRLFTALLTVSGARPIAIEPSALQPEAPRVRPGHLPPEEISRVLERGRRQLSRCYERSLRLHPEVQGRLRLRVTVGPAGDVRRVSVVGAEATSTAELRECVATYAERWAFPPPGGPVTFELPLTFAARAP